MLTTSAVLCMPGSFQGRRKPPTIKLYKCTIMLQWCLSAACRPWRGWLVGCGVGWGCTELMQQNIDKTPEGKAAAGWRDILHLGEVFIFTARAVKRKSSGSGSKTAVSISLQRRHGRARALIQLCGRAIIVQSKCLLCLTWKIHKLKLYKCKSSICIKRQLSLSKT